jgi:hypothetical protein
MKKLIVLTLLAASFTTMYAESSLMSNNTIEQNLGRRYYRGYKGNVSSKDLPSEIRRYLDKHYPDYELVVSKRKGNGYYYVKIRYNHDSYRPYYRSLVFDEDGRVVKG